MPTITIDTVPAPVLDGATLRLVATTLAGEPAEAVQAWIEAKAAEAAEAADQAVAQEAVNQAAAAIMLRDDRGWTPRPWLVQDLVVVDWDHRGLDIGVLLDKLRDLDAYLTVDFDQAVDDDGRRADGRRAYRVTFHAGVLRNTEAHGMAYRAGWLAHIES